MILLLRLYTGNGAWEGGGVGEWGVEGEEGGVDNKGNKGGSCTVQLK